MCGTYRKQEKNQDPATGLEDVEPASLAEAVLWPFRRHLRVTRILGKVSTE